MFLFSTEYFPVLIFVIVSFILASVIYGLSFVIARQANDFEKASAYECGFDPFEDARNAFDIRFYLVAILFLVFDLEAVFLFPWTASLDQLSMPGWATMMEFLGELVVGFVYAWKKGALEWE
jgi:NADH-quinone oxidoreductase subunit A